MDRTEALAIAFANLKGSKDKELIKTAQALDFLKKLPEFGSDPSVADEVGVSGEIVREFLKLLDLPSQVQLLLERKELGLEQGRRLWQLKRYRPEIVAEAATAARKLTAHDTRHLIDYLIRHPDISVSHAQKVINESKPAVSHEFRVVVRISEEDYRRLSSQARSLHKSIPTLVHDIVSDWIQTQSRNE